MAFPANISPQSVYDFGRIDPAQQIEYVMPTRKRQRTSVSKLLSVFGAVPSPTSVTKMSKSARNLRAKEPVVYTISDDNSTPSASPAVSAFASPDSSRAFEVIPIDDDDEANGFPLDHRERRSEEHTTQATDYASSAPHARPRPPPTRDLPSRSTRASVNYDIVRVNNQSTSKKPGSKGQPILISDIQLKDEPKQKQTLPPKMDTARNRVRADIATNTKAKQDAFVLKHKDIFLPLLPPEHNYVYKLEQKSKSAETRETVTHENLIRQPNGIKANMKPYQLEGLSWLVYMYKNGMSAILGDEMGLGKTLQTLSLFSYLEEHNPVVGENRPYLVVCPLSVLSSWVAEAQKWAPHLKVLRFHGPPVERNKLKDIAQGKMDHYGNKVAQPKKRQRKNTGMTVLTTDIRHVNVIVTTYESFVAEQSWFKSAFVWRYCVLDEGHKIKNEKSNVAHALQSLRSEFRLLLTGTPIQNDLQEMWALLHWLFPDIFTIKTRDMFKDAFNLTKGKVSTSFMDDARRLLELVMMRRMKNSPTVDLGLPPKEEILIYVPLTPMQRFWYTRLLTRMEGGLLDDLFKGLKNKEKQTLNEEAQEGKDWAHLAAVDQPMEAQPDRWAESKEILRQALENEKKDSGDSAWKKLMNLIMQLRKCCSHPYLLPHAEPPVPYELGPHIVQASGKFIVLDKLINELVLKQGKKILIFSGMTKTLDLCEELLVLKGAKGHDAPFRYSRLDGGTARARRNLAIRMFNRPDSEEKIMLISTRAGGLGINLASASTVVFLDEDWNPQVTLQAEARAHRIGQTQPVTVYKLCTQGTVEEQMMGRIRKKLYLATKITESMRNIHSTEGTTVQKTKGRKSTGMETEEMPQFATSQLKSFLRRGAQTLSHPEVDVTEMLTWNWETTLERCKDQPSDPHVADQTASAEVDEEQWLSAMEKVECAVFEGKKFVKAKDAEETALELSRSDRRVGKNTTVMIDGFAINKESLGCADWEAVPTMAGKDPRLAEPKREKKPPINHQEHCQVCFGDGELVVCSSCPRGYHLKCLSDGFKSKAMGKIQFYCPQHECADCGSKTTDAGGLIYRCRWCERGHCEDCLDWEKVHLLGENLKEYDLLRFDANNQAYYVQCHRCVEEWEQDPERKSYFEALEAEVDADYAGAFHYDVDKTASPAEDAMSLTDGPTATSSSGFATPRVTEVTEPAPPTTHRKSPRKSASATASRITDLYTMYPTTAAESPKKKRATISPSASRTATPATTHSATDTVGGKRMRALTPTPDTGRSTPSATYSDQDTTSSKRRRKWAEQGFIDTLGNSFFGA
ncbi:hypothetical protein LTR66_006989 [Elasticomyces elasticus]|nr:hypothetical protein LTR66_006989 [Elasticomyces elasticus]